MFVFEFVLSTQCQQVVHNICCRFPKPEVTSLTDLRCPTKLNLLSYQAQQQNLALGHLQIDDEFIIHQNSISYSSAAVVDRDSSQYFPLSSLSFQQWVINSAESEKGERGAGKGGSFRVQGSLALSPLFSFLTVSPKHMTRLNPKTQAALCGSLAIVTLVTSVCFFYHECLIL